MNRALTFLARRGNQTALDILVRRLHAEVAALQAGA